MKQFFSSWSIRNAYLPSYRSTVDLRLGYLSFTLPTTQPAAESCVALKQPRVSSLVFTYRTAEVQLMSDRPGTLGLVPVELSTSIYGSHAATYVVTYTYLKYVFTYVSERIHTLVHVSL